MISDRFLPESTGNWQEFTGKNPKNFRPEYCFHFRGISGAFPRDTVTFPHLSCRIPQDMVAGIFVLGTYSCCHSIQYLVASTNTSAILFSRSSIY
jgi:hypothetical protein